MKKLLLPVAILLFAAACTKHDMPTPANTKAEADTYRPASTMRKWGDTAIKFTNPRTEKSPIKNFKDAGT